MSLDVKPVFRVTLAKRTASSSCCGAKLDLLTEDDGTSSWMCRECDRPCDRVLSDPEEVTAGG